MHFHTWWRDSRQLKAFERQEAELASGRKHGQSKAYGGSRPKMGGQAILSKITPYSVTPNDMKIVVAGLISVLHWRNWQRQRVAISATL